MVAMDSLTADCHQLPTEFQLHIGQQLVCVLDMIHIARKMRVASDTSRLASQATDNQVAVAGPPESLQKPASGGPFPRRYSTAQEEGEGEIDSFDSDQILQRFTSSMALHQFSRLRGPAASTSEWSSSMAKASQPLTPQALTKCLSTSDISNMAPNPAAISGTSANPPEQSPGLISRYLGRRGSAGNVLARVSPDGLKSLESSSAQNSEGSAVVPSATSLTRRRASFDVTDSSSSGDTAQGSGFGILSRTRQFGAWLTKATEGEKVEVSPPDLNVVAPTSF